MEEKYGTCGFVPTSRCMQGRNFIYDLLGLVVEIAISNQ